MLELTQYIKTLKERGPLLSCRELTSRLFRGNSTVSILRVAEVCKKAKKSFTFFITGICAVNNEEAVRMIIDGGHEIGCHGFYHRRFDLMEKDEIIEDIGRMKDFF